ncbi:hypothetical protein [Halomarina oriensis]|uniref:DUF8160 domain-containing protein n=1 Tax=Halomarina oriensis TaxID=671145 RepID=A0A6B0GJK8_9EURY|nr:hypothetical protein [Halomarina oriensis]MWG34041.1 hypothetical protein [Halomarina oriensis]
MADDLDERKEDMWGMDEVRSTGASSEAVDTQDSSDTTERGTPPTTDDNSDTSDASDTTHTSKASVTSDTTEASGETVRQLAIDAQRKQLAVRDLHNVNVYLYESIYREMVATFKQLDSEYFQQHGDELSKNKEFFNAVFRAGLNSPQLRQELELDD